MSKKDILVYFDHLSANDPVPLGVLSVQMIRGKELFSFVFDPSFLNQSAHSLLDPDLQFYAGPQFTDKANFGFFMDSAPDRWGRKLMQRREALRAKRAGPAEGVKPFSGKLPANCGQEFFWQPDLISRQND